MLLVGASVLLRLVVSSGTNKSEPSLSLGSLNASASSVSLERLLRAFFPDHYRFRSILIDDNRLITSAGSQPVGELRRVALDAGLVFEDLLLCQNGVTG
jgi:hypothetical protein